jgi:hypothetical protein
MVKFAQLGHMQFTGTTPSKPNPIKLQSIPASVALRRKQAARLPFAWGDRGPDYQMGRYDRTFFTLLRTILQLTNRIRYAAPEGCRRVTLAVSDSDRAGWLRKSRTYPT